MTPVRIGEVAAMTGNSAGLGQFTHMGVLLAVEEMTQTGGLLGRPVELHSEDTRSAAGETATATRKLVTRDHVVAMVGEGASGRCLEGAQVAQALRIPVVSPSATSPKVTEVGDEIFRVCFTDPFQGSVMARFARRHFIARTAALLLDAGSEYSLGLAEFFRREFTAAGGKIVADERFGGADKDFRAQLTVIKAANPDVVFAPCYYGSAGLLVLQARQLGLSQPLLGGDGWEAPELIQVAGDAAEGVCFPVHFTDRNPAPAAQDFFRRFTKRFGRGPTGVSALGYDAAMLVGDAIRRAGSAEPEAIRTALAATRDYPGITGLITIDAQRNARKPATVMQVRHGVFEPLDTVAAE